MVHANLNFLESTKEKNHHTKQVNFVLNFNIDACFLQIIKSSFASFYGVNWRKINDYMVGYIFKGKDSNKYLLSALNPPYKYQLITEIDNTFYQTTYELNKIKDNKTRIIYSQSFFVDKNLKSFRGSIGVINFNQEFTKKSKKITLELYRGLKDDAKISKN